MKRYLLLFITLCLCFSAEAQNDIRSQFEAYKQKRSQEYRDYRDKANAEFAEYLKKRWADYKPQAAIPSPIPEVLPKPQQAPEEPKDTPTAKPAPKPSPKPLPEPKSDVESVRKIAERERPTSITPATSNALSVDFFGDALSVPLTKSKLPYMTLVDEASFSAIWSVLSTIGSNAVKYLEQYSTSHALNGWGCYQLIKKVSEQAYSEENVNERIALQAFMLAQLKYGAQVASCGDKLVLLLPFKEQIYGVSYLTLKSQNFYIYSYGHNSSNMYRTYENNFSYAANKLSAAMNGNMKIGSSKQVQFPRLGSMLGVSLSAPISMGNIALQYGYPILDNIVYYKQSLPTDFAKAILTPVKQKIAGMNELEAVNFLLNFVQNGFGYADDDEVFGRQKQLFIEESFFYGQNNCKDRVGVFSWLVKELMGLDVVALRYEGNAASNGVGHIACAVCFTQSVTGDNYMHKGKRYVVCDPTYINAKAGNTMPMYAKSQPAILAL